jgi:SAM-dependent methyltransferase
VDTEGKVHWEKVYGTKAEDEVSWYEPRPELSLQLVRSAIVHGARSVIDVGGGTSRLVDALVAEDLDRLAVLDVSETALQRAKERLGSAAQRVDWICGDVLHIEGVGRFDVWHDRALFHFLTSEDSRRSYRALLERTVDPGGFALIATFGPQGPERCSGLDVRRYDTTTLEREIGPSFVLKESHLVDHVTPQSRHQQFLYAIFSRT